MFARSARGICAKAHQELHEVNKSILAVFLMLPALGLAACGSSGGSQQPAPPPPLVVSPPDPSGPDPLSFPDEPGLTAAQESQRRSIADSAEFQAQWSLAAMGADYAYARGYTGQGVTVGIIDTGIDANHSAFAEKLHPSSGVVSQSCPSGICAFSPIRDTASHGTAVGGVIAAAKNGGRMHGVAYGAELLALGIQLGAPQPVYQPVDLSNAASYRSLDEQGQGLYRRLSGATRIVNHSFGYEGIVTAYTAAEYRAAFGRTVDSLLQAGTPDSEKIILVWAAGNSNGRRDAQGNLADASSPNLTAATPHYFPGLRGHFVSVVATRADGTITSWSNRCGVAADYCIAAPGLAILGPSAGSAQDYQLASGTSLATPQVAGALALMEEAFRGQLGSTELVTRLFAAADKSGIYSDRDTYGQGLLDIEKATRPIGASSAALGHTLDGPSVSMQRTAIAAGPAWGDALQRGLAGREMAVFDSLNAPFFIPMAAFHAPWALDGGLRTDRRFAGFLDRASQSVPESTAVIGKWTLSSAIGLAGAPFPDESSRQAIGGTASVQDAWIAPGTPGFPNAWLGLGTPGLGVAGEILNARGRARLRSGFFIQNSGVTRGEPLMAPGRASGAFLGMDLRGGARAFSAELGLLRESERLLGAGAAGAYGQLAGNTWFTRLVAKQELGGGLRLVAVAQGGYTSAEANHGLLRGARHVLSSAYSAGILWEGKAPGNAKRFWLTVSQPLRNESGALELDYPAGRTRAGGVVRETAWLGVEPSGRQIDLTLGYEVALHRSAGRHPAWRIRAEAWHSQQPGHRAAAPPETTLFLALSRSF